MHTVTYAASLHLLQQHVRSLPSNVLWHQLIFLTLQIWIMYTQRCHQHSPIRERQDLRNEL